MRIRLRCNAGFRGEALRRRAGAVALDPDLGGVARSYRLRYSRKRFVWARLTGISVPCGSLIFRM